jgi:hypothetical protein
VVDPDELGVLPVAAEPLPEVPGPTGIVPSVGIPAVIPGTSVEDNGAGGLLASSEQANATSNAIAGAQRALEAWPKRRNLSIVTSKPVAAHE